MDSSLVDETPRNGAQGRDLTTGSIPRLLITFSLPLLIGNFIQAAYSIVNRVWVGQFLGEASVAAITNTMMVAFILVALANGLTLGSSIVVSQFAGARNWEGVRRVVQNSLLLVIVLGVVLLVVGQLATVPLLHAVHTPPGETFALAEGYMRLFLLSFPLMFTAILTTFLLRGVGDSLTPLVFQGVGVGLTALLDPLFMLGWLGFPKLGLNGTAVAMLVAQTLAIVTFFIYLHRKRHIAAPDWRRLRFDWPINTLTLKIALPSAAQQLLVSVGSMFILVFINDYGDATTAGFGLASQVDMLAFFVAMSFSMAIANLVGQNIGARRFERVREIFWWGLLLSGSMVLLVSLATVLFPGAIMGMFVNVRENPEVARIGSDYLRIIGPSYLCFAVMFVGIGVINGSGHTLVTTLITLLGLWLVRVPLAGYLSHRLGDVRGVWYALAISFIVPMVMSLLYYASGRWKRMVIHPTPHTAGTTDAPTPIVDSR